MTPPKASLPLRVEHPSSSPSQNRKAGTSAGSFLLFGIAALHVLRKDNFVHQYALAKPS